MSEDEESLVICVRRVRLYLYLILFEEFPILAVLEASLHEDAIEVGWEVLPTHDLTDEVHLGLKVSLRAHLCTHLLHHV